MSDTIEKIKSLPNNNSMRYLQNRHETDFCECADAGFSTDDLIRLAEALEAAEGALKEAPRQVPTNWLDPLLTGPESVIDAAPRQVEALLRAIQDRIREVTDEALTKIAEAKK